MATAELTLEGSFAYQPTAPEQSTICPSYAGCGMFRCNVCGCHISTATKQPVSACKCAFRKGVEYQTQTHKPLSAEIWNPVTQKAKGVVALREFTLEVPEYKVFTVSKLTDRDKNYLLGKFVRPCPMRPRHGFVDSRVVNTKEELEQLIIETLAADPEAEFIAMAHIDARYSGIWTPGLLTIGKGTDGATAGTSAIPLPVLGDYIDDRFGLKSKAAVTEQPYLELLWGGANMYEVQLRNGPVLPQTIDYIPAEMTVETIVEAVGDLLEWETKMRQVSKGTVVYHPNGSLASHYAVHAVLNNIPVLISREPKIGEVLKPSAGSTTNPIDLNALRAGFYFGCTADTNYETAAYAMLAGCHNSVVWKGKYDILIGLAMGFGFRLTVAAGLGENRHKGRVKHKMPKYGRDHVYQECWNDILSQATRTKFQEALDNFLNLEWEGGFGGVSWFKFVRFAAVLYNCIIEGKAEQAVEAFNLLINSAHNNGWGFNKFIGDEWMNTSAKNPVKPAIRCAPLLYQALAQPQAAYYEGVFYWKRKRRITIPVFTEADLEKHNNAPVEHESCMECGECKLCGDCSCKGTVRRMGEIVYAQAKVNKNDEMVNVHIQYKYERMPSGKPYFSKDIVFYKGSSLLGVPEWMPKFEEELKKGVQCNSLTGNANSIYCMLPKTSRNHFGCGNFDINVKRGKITCQETVAA